MKQAILMNRYSYFPMLYYSMVQYLYTNITSLYNMSHSGFPLKFLNEERMNALIPKIPLRLQKINLFDVGLDFEVSLDCYPRKDDTTFGKFTLQELETNRSTITPIPIPVIPEV